MKVFVINLASRPERLAHMQETFGRIGVEFERFDAVNTDQAAVHPAVKRLPLLRTGRPWHPFDLACLLSHYELWNRIADGEDEFGAIFEDDVIVGPAVIPLLQGDIPLDADIVKLETVQQVIYLDRRAVPMRTGSGCFRRLRSRHEGTGAYILSRRGADTLRRSIDQFDECVDHAMFSPALASRQGMRVYQAVPAVAIQGVFLPDVGTTPVMQSDRATDPQWLVWAKSKPQSLLSRIAGRLVNQARGIRISVPFVLDSTAE